MGLDFMRLEELCDKVKWHLTAVSVWCACPTVRLCVYGSSCNDKKPMEAFQAVLKKLISGQ